MLAKLETLNSGFYAGLDGRSEMQSPSSPLTLTGKHVQQADAKVKGGVDQDVVALMQGGNGKRHHSKKASEKTNGFETQGKEERGQARGQEFHHGEDKGVRKVALAGPGKKT